MASSSSGDTVLDDLLQVKRQLLWPVQCDERCHRDQAAITGRQIRVGPDLTKEDSLADVEQLGCHLLHRVRRR